MNNSKQYRPITDEPMQQGDEWSIVSREDWDALPPEFFGCYPRAEWRHNELRVRRPISDTPETDAFGNRPAPRICFEPEVMKVLQGWSEFAGKLEQQRDEARAGEFTWAESSSHYAEKLRQMTDHRDSLRRWLAAVAETLNVKDGESYIGAAQRRMDDIQREQAAHEATRLQVEELKRENERLAGLLAAETMKDAERAGISALFHDEECGCDTCTLGREEACFGPFDDGPSRSEELLEQERSISAHLQTIIALKDEIAELRQPKTVNGSSIGLNVAG